MSVSESYHTILVGSGFANSFFLLEHLKHLPENARILVLERGQRWDHAKQVEHRDNAAVNFKTTFNSRGEKAWWFTVGFGGGSNCWWACVPRQLPNDFRLKSTYGVGRDWPVDYDTLEPFYTEIEEVMSVSGGHESPYPRSKPYPQPPHRFMDTDVLFRKAFPGQWFHQPTARARVSTSTRPACCGNGMCTLCPADAKFTITNGLAYLYDDPRVDLRIGAEALSVDIEGGTAKGVIYRQDGRERRASAELVVLGANAIFNAFLMLKSGMEHRLLGRRIHEQLGIYATVGLNNVENFNGSTSITGLGYMFADGAFRKDHAAFLIENWNTPPIATFRPEPGRWRQTMRLRFDIEDLPQDENRVVIDPDDPDKPLVIFEHHSDYAMKGLEAVKTRVPEMLSALPIEDVVFDPKTHPTEAHVQGTTCMGHDPADSVVDAGLISHSVRNIVVTGASVFPTGPVANPTLTLSALAVRAARLIG